MMKFLERFRRPVAPPPPPEPAPIPQIVMTARPLVVGPGQDPVAQARYRLDAIKRHIEQHDVSPEKMKQFRDATFDLLGALHKYNAITPEQEMVARNLVGI